MKRFLEQVLAQTGYYCLMTPKTLEDGTKIQIHHVVDSIDELVKKSEKLKTTENIFFACGTLKEEKVWNPEKPNKKTGEKGAWQWRTHDNMSHFKSFFLDLDCNGNKPSEYKNKDEALLDLKRFAKELGLPRPTIIDSGGGIHCYWVLEAEITSDIWFKVARRFKLVSEHLKLKADPSRTSDMSSVLRVPDTFNYKKDTAKEVKILCDSAPMKFDDFIRPIKNYLDAHPEVSVPTVKQHNPLFDDFEDVYNPKRNDYDAELIYSNCDQMAYIRAVGGPVGYQLRASAVSIIKLTKQQDYSVLVANDLNPDVVESQTEMQIHDSITDNPHTCTRFESNHPNGCDNCKLKGLIGSPIRIEAATKKPITVSEYEKLPQEEQAKIKQVVSDTCEIPEGLPPGFKYTDTPKKLIYHDTEVEDGKPIIVFEGIIYPTEIFVDRETHRETITIYIDAGKDDSKLVNIPSGDFVDAKTLSKVLAAYGVLLGEKAQFHLRYYMKWFTDIIKGNQRSTTQISQLGWTKDHSAFATHERAFKKDGTEYAIQLGRSISSLGKRFGTSGTLEGWREAIDSYGRKGSENYAFAHLAGYGSLLLEMTQLSGGLLSIKGDSGSGKSTLLDTIDTMWGVGNSYMKKADSLAARDVMLGGLNNYCATFDELSNIDPAVLTEWVYTFTQGAGKNTLTQSRELRDNLSTWKMFGVLTSNSSMIQRLASNKADASAEIYRLVEYNIDLNDQHLSKAEGDDTFIKLCDNYGHAGPIFAKYLVTNYSAIKEQLRLVQREIDDKLNIRSNERYWSAIVACNIVGGEIAYKLGLNNFDMVAVREFAENLVVQMRGSSQESVKDAKSLISDYISCNVGTMIIIDKYGENVIPRSEVHSRFETELGKLYIAKDHLRRFIIKAGADFTSVMKELMSSKIVLDDNKRYTLTKGTSLPSSGQPYCIVVDSDCTAMRGVVIEEVVKKRA